MSAFETRARGLLEQAGYRVLRNGWPDCVLLDEFGRLTLMIELKARADVIRPEQVAMHHVLENAGIDVRVVREWELPALLEELRTAAAEGRERMQGLRASVNRLPSFWRA